MRNVALHTLFAVAVLGWHAASAAEICGNGVDDDGNGLTDEGCYPTLTTGVCESPLSCDDTGMVSWTTGALHYDLPPDVAVHVPYGPPLSFHRYYTSMSSPGANPTSVNQTPLGPGWGHNYLSWVYPYTDAGGMKHVILHTPQGQDVLFTYKSSDATYDYYVPQSGFRVQSFKISRDPPGVLCATHDWRDA